MIAEVPLVDDRVASMAVCAPNLAYACGRERYLKPAADFTEREALSAKTARLHLFALLRLHTNICSRMGRTRRAALESE
jgi:hypothetical protein